MTGQDMLITDRTGRRTDGLCVCGGGGRAAGGMRECFRQSSYRENDLKGRILTVAMRMYRETMC